MDSTGLSLTDSFHDDTKMTTATKNNFQQAEVPEPVQLEMAALTPTRGSELLRVASRRKSSFFAQHFWQREVTPEEEWHTPFCESVYTLLYMYHPTTRAFWYSLFVYALQISSVVLTLMDILDDEASGFGMLNIPPMVGLTVTISQAVTLLLSLAYQQDLIEAVLKLQAGYYPEVLEKHPGATFSTWLLSCVAQLMAGLLLLNTIFILTMQVENVLSIMLNFAALHFMAEIDDVGFAIAKMGFVTNELQRQCKAVADFQVPKRDKGNRLRRILYLLGLVYLFTGYALIKQKQLQGDFLPTVLFVQFGDGYNAEIAYYSGYYISKTGRTSGRREYRYSKTMSILLAFCSAEEAWTFSKTDDPCDYFARSPKTNTYDVSTIPKDQWFIKESNSRLSPFDSFHLVNRDSTEELCQGEWIDGLCRCSEGQFGLDCEFPAVCPHIYLNAAMEEDLQIAQAPISTDFGLLYNSTGHIVLYNDVPVYYSNDTIPANVLIFGGRRWVLTTERQILGKTTDEFWSSFNSSDNTGIFTPDETAATIQNKSGWHLHYGSRVVPFFLSDPVDYQTPEYRPTPVDLGWYSTVLLNETEWTFGLGNPVDAFFECKSCSSHLGGHCHLAGGKCNETTGICECFEGFFGDQCEEKISCFAQETPCGGRDRGNCDQFSGECQCLLPFYGKLCEHKFNCLEKKGKCYNGGVCEFDPNAVGGRPTSRYKCRCPDPATWGESCERRVDCTTTTCENGGVCDQDTRRCICPAPYHGILCNLLDSTQEDLFCSEDDDCVDGTCATDTGLCTCNDPQAYGTLCQYQFNCTESGCRNEGTCNITSELCECQYPYRGQDCSQLEDCLVAGCLGSGVGSGGGQGVGPGLGPGVRTGAGSEVGPGVGAGVCNATTGACTCDGPATGKLCEVSNNCHQAHCYNGGKCAPHGSDKGTSCACKLPYDGHLCDYIIEDDAIVV